MKIFACSCCRQLVYFENTHCTRCGSLLGFLPRQREVLAFVDLKTGYWQALDDREQDRRYRPCRNLTEQGVCNWMLGPEEDGDYCLSCRLTRTLPNLDKPRNLGFWKELETQKRRLLFSLLRLELPLEARWEHPEGLAFDFLEDLPEFNEQGRVMTGHAAGLITINVAEADPVERERLRSQMAEPYRTLLGHFRHESGHYYWERLVRDTHWLEVFRQQFGDERRDYLGALQYHYEQGPVGDWQDYYVSAYASSHPWEDWAETWSHYLHLLDTLETAWQFGLQLQPWLPDTPQMQLHQGFDPYQAITLEELVDKWLPLTYALNSLSQSMGQTPLYPFVLSPAAINKLALVHRIIHGRTE
ncbi:MAG: putative zinc-binding metallopeptidase [Halothiobacillaceae bacterium]